MNAVEAKEKYEFELLKHGASFVAADPDSNTLIIAVKDPEVVEWAKAHIKGVRLKFIKGGEMVAW